jgi:hypothetical protein
MLLDKVMQAALFQVLELIFLEKELHLGSSAERLA